ncbi:hypothetical protein ACRZEY_002602, partial [Klebsiella michiganensis]
RCGAGCLAAVFFPACAALSRATGSHRLRIGNPDRRNAPPPGKVRCRMLCCGFLPGGAALTGLRVHNRLRIGSPDRRNAPPPGKVRCRVPCCGFLHGLRCA